MDDLSRYGADRINDVPFTLRTSNLTLVLYTKLLAIISGMVDSLRVAISLWIFCPNASTRIFSPIKLNGISSPKLILDITPVNLKVISSPKSFLPEIKIQNTNELKLLYKHLNGLKIDPLIKTYYN